MKLRIEYDRVKQFFIENPDEIQDSDLLRGIGINVETKPEDYYNYDPSYWLSEARDSVLTEIFGQFEDVEVLPDSKGLILELDILDKLIEVQETVTDYILRSYDGLKHSWEQDGWEYFDLGGDDDVDYNGGYLDAGFALIKQYIECHKFNLFNLDLIKEVTK